MRDGAGTPANNGPMAPLSRSSGPGEGALGTAVGTFRRIAGRSTLLSSGVVRVLAFSLVLVGLAIAGYIAWIRPLPALNADRALPWPLLAAAFGLVELKVVEVHFRRETHGFSLSELPAVVGLFFVRPDEYLVALLVGSAAALMLGSRQSPVKLLFNLSNYAFVAVISLAVFRAIATEAGPPTNADWFGTFAATLSSGVLGAVAIATAITLSGGAPQFQKLPEMVQFGSLVAVANSSIALLAVTILWYNPGGLWLLALPVATLFLGYRAYVSEREKHERLELLYQSSRILQHSPELDVALLALLDHARAMFRAELAEVVLQPGPGADRALRTASLQDAPSDVMVPVEPSPPDPSVLRAMSERRAIFAIPAMTPGGLTLSIRQAMVAPLVGETGVIGTITIANRLTEGTSFGTDDLRLLETLANQAAVALENGQLEQSLAELSRLKEQLRYQAFHDPLTDLPNRALFAEQVETRLRGMSHDGTLPVVLFLDLDDFKVVNDTMGHAAGDALLVAVAERIRGCVREGNLAARLGGDEFAILLDDVPNLGDSAAVARRLIDALGESFPMLSEDVVVGASIGIAMARGPDQPADELLRNADVAMYTAKAAGKRRFAVFEPTMHASIVARHELSADLARGVGRGELVIHHQPIIALDSGRVVGVEALVRWVHPTRGLVPPEDFIALAEETGTILPLGRRVMSEAGRQVKALNESLPEDRRLSLSVNVSALQVQQPDFLAEVEGILREIGLAPQSLILEITETAMFRDTQATIRKLEALRERGVRIAIDDFGTGYSSLSYLRRFPVDILKIAKDFVGRPDSAAQDWAFAAAIVALGRTLGLRIIAEGIEEAGQLERLRELGCEFGQGYLFGRPAPIQALATLLDEQSPAGGGPGGSAAVGVGTGAEIAVGTGGELAVGTTSPVGRVPAGHAAAAPTSGRRRPRPSGRCSAA